MAVHREYFAKLSRHPAIVGIVTELIGEDIKLLQSMSLLKPPGMQGKNQCAVLYSGVFIHHKNTEMDNCANFFAWLPMT